MPLRLTHVLVSLLAKSCGQPVKWQGSCKKFLIAVWLLWKRRRQIVVPVTMRDAGNLPNHPVIQSHIPTIIDLITKYSLHSFRSF
uniref:Putative secreted protein n=1 Tax=Anopheles triannulatus TaxID=58253 RepID=A0A2M4B5W7_9DIPT